MSEVASMIAIGVLIGFGVRIGWELAGYAGGLSKRAGRAIGRAWARTVYSVNRGRGDLS